MKVWNVIAAVAFAASTTWVAATMAAEENEEPNAQLRGSSVDSAESATSTAEDDHSNVFPSESSCNRVSTQDECRVTIDSTTNQACEWCVAGAIPSECMSPEQAQLLPTGVFECSTPGVVNKADTDTDTNNGLLIEFRDNVSVLVRSNKPDEKDFCDSSSKSISGYMDLKGSDYDEKGEDKHLFFWMFEKRASEQDEQEESSSDDEIPFVVWLTGGPGCSSTLALLTENGPCSVNKDGKTTTRNPYSWTEAAHVLWLDQPAGVGFSYGSEDDSNEQMVAEDAYYFLQAFFQTFPQYQKNPLYIIGESYAGHYVPAIAHRVHTGNKENKPKTIPLPLSGLAIGNGLTNPEQQYPWYPEMVWNNSHHIQVVSEDVHDAMEDVVPKCTALIHKCNQGDGMINTFACQSAFVLCNIGLTSPYQATGLNPYDIRIPCEVPPLCYDMSYISEWLNSESTKKALHVDEHHSHAWQSCNFGINMQFHTDWMKDFSPFVKDLLEAGIPALIYAGDVDFVCNYLGNRAWTLNLEWKHQADFVAAPEKDWNKGKGLARTANGLTFLQVYDAGHMVPKDQPEVALDMLKHFLSKKPFY